MIQRATGPQCLSSRVSALADGSLPDDVRDRALAHVTSCPDCRADLEAEQLIRARLQALPSPRPSASLMASLLAMGEPGGPMPPRPGHVPGMPRPRPVAIGRTPLPDAPWQALAPGRRSTSRSAGLPARPGPTSRPGGRVTPRRRAVVGATAGAVGVGVIAAALASGLPAAQRGTPTDQLRATVTTGSTSSPGVLGQRGFGASVAAFGTGEVLGSGSRLAAGPVLGAGSGVGSAGAPSAGSASAGSGSGDAAWAGGVFETQSAWVDPWSVTPRTSWFSTGTLADSALVPAVTTTALRHVLSSGR